MSKEAYNFKLLVEASLYTQFAWSMNLEKKMELLEKKIPYMHGHAIEQERLPREA